MDNAAARVRSLEALEGMFGDRVRRAPETTRALAEVSPRDAGEVEGLAALAGRFSVPLVPLGAGTLTRPDGPGDGILVRFDLMGAIGMPEGDEPWVEAEPGSTLLSLENNLESRGLGLAVYPTSAPRATVGGWLSGEGIGVGSFEYGPLPDNVLSADVVTNGGEKETVPGPDLPGLLRANPGALVVRARLKTRHAKDTPFAARFGDPADAVRATASLAERDVPLWHLAFLNAAMSRARGLGEETILFGAYPGERTDAVSGNLAAVLEKHAGQELPPAEAHRVWGQRFFPVAPSHPTPRADRKVVPLREAESVLRSETRPVQGNVSRSRDVLLLTLATG